MDTPAVYVVISIFIHAIKLYKTTPSMCPRLLVTQTCCIISSPSASMYYNFNALHLFAMSLISKVPDVNMFNNIMFCVKIIDQG